ncbi:MAG: hypothetical protein ACKPH1_08620 [Microcystis panniformis]|jgi:hypothetical protein|uniref:Uncharacterized protein n=1 Tax=Microcystis aeruginosa Ma_MB_S_20031200_S102 TaxID=2486254 RepID=A0A552ETW1_MICAE|nr:MAG: hypothetical protein EWV79_18890 [Microcystis aeruginosa Ma_MB_S_20031200_S102D]TRU37894.1 MAG: hypothetical protein EWV92_09605 [Microcystis aeruginosa Ma_MB_S_20031200_S102]
MPPARTIPSNEEPGFTSFEVANYLIFREKVPKFPPDHCHIQYFLISKRSKSFTQQGFELYSASPK